MNNLDCTLCHGQDTFKEEVIRYCDESGPEPFFVENVPAFVCIQCTDKAIPEAVLAVIKSFRAGEGTPVSTQTLPVFDFNNLEGNQGQSGQ